MPQYTIRYRAVVEGELRVKASDTGAAQAAFKSLNVSDEIRRRLGSKIGAATLAVDSVAVATAVQETTPDRILLGEDKELPIEEGDDEYN